MQNYTKFQHLTEYAETLRKAGFTIIAPENSDYTWFWGMKDNKFFAVDADKFGAFNLSTDHKPSLQHGTGFRVYDRIYTPDVTHAERTLDRPSWANIYSGIKYYNSIEEFMQGHKWCKPYIVTDEETVS
jgi:hypothetical protein